MEKQLFHSPEVDGPSLASSACPRLRFKSVLLSDNGPKDCELPSPVEPPLHVPPEVPALLPGLDFFFRSIPHPAPCAQYPPSQYYSLSLGNCFEYVDSHLHCFRRSFHPQQLSLIPRPIRSEAIPIFRFSTLREQFHFN